MAEISMWYVVFMGIGTVFVGLICLILICKALGAVLSIKKNKPEKSDVTNSTPITSNKEEILAVIAAAIAASSKTDVKNIRIISVNKVK